MDGIDPFNIDEQTPILGLTKPAVGASDDTWGEKLNGNFDILDSYGATSNARNNGQDASIAANAAAIAANAAAIADNNAHDIIQDNQITTEHNTNVTQNGQIASNTTNIATNTANIATNTTNIAANTAAIATKVGEAPNDGQLYGRKNLGWTVVTTGGGGGASVLVSDTPPVGAADNSLWWESDTGQLYIKYNDGDSSQWVVAVPQIDAASFIAKSGDTMTGPLILSADPTVALGAATKQYVDSNSRRAARVLAGADTLVPSDYGKLIIFNSATAFTLAITAAATLGDGWWCDIFNSNVGTCTIDPNGSESIDGIATATVYTSERMRIVSALGGFTTMNHACDWNNWPVTFTSTGGGTPGTTVNHARWKKLRTQVFLALDVTLTNTTGVNYLVAQAIPVAPHPSLGAHSLAGQEAAISGKLISWQASAGVTTTSARYYDNGPTVGSGMSGARYMLNGSYECARNA